MAGQPAIELIKAIPTLVVNEGASLRLVNFHEYFQSTIHPEEPLEFFAELKDGRSLPTGLICTSNGQLSGIPANETQGNYQAIVTAQNFMGEQLSAEFELKIKERPKTEIHQDLTRLKSAVWEALENNLPSPELEALLNRDISPIEIYYLLQRYATFSIWDVMNLAFPGDKVPLNLPGASPLYNVYDRGCCIVASPKDLYDYERTLEDGLQTARAVAKEAYKRGWAVEFAGFNKMVRVAWVELQLQAIQHNKPIDILHYTPGTEDMMALEMEKKSAVLKPEV